MVPRTLRGSAGFRPCHSCIRICSHPGQHVSVLHPWLFSPAQGPTVAGRCRTDPAGRSSALAFWTPHVHIGASGLIFALIAFLIVSGFLERRLVSFAVAVLVGFIYGGTLVSGVLPRLKSHISSGGASLLRRGR